MRPLVALALVAALAPAAPIPKSLKKADDKTLIVGTWKVHTLSVNGQRSESASSTFIFDEGGTVKLLYGGKDNGSKWTWTIDPNASPAGMRWVNDGGRNSWDCVYVVDGDTLKVGFISTGAKRPEKVEPGDGLTLYVMTRDTSAK